VKHAGVDLKSTRTSGEITIEADTLDTLRIDILMEIKQKIIHASIFPFFAPKTQRAGRHQGIFSSLMPHPQS